MRRREFITLLSSAAAAWPLVARAQQPTVPVIGFLRPTKAEQSGHLVAAFRQGLRESGYPGDKVSIEARWADGRAERLPKLAAELVDLQVAAIVGNVDAALVAKAATTSIPIGVKFEKGRRQRIRACRVHCITSLWPIMDHRPNRSVFFDPHCHIAFLCN